MEMEKEHADELIAAYLAGKLDRASAEELRAWVMSSPEHERHFREQEELWFSAVSPQALEIYDGSRAFEVFRQRVADATRRRSSAGRIQLHWRRVVRYAAAVAAIMLITFFAYEAGEKKVKNALGDTSIEVPHGSRMELYLPDSTRVCLNAGSCLTYSQGFGIDDRHVSLSGEGYFEVKRNTRLPFSVSTSSMRVKVLGTKFNFRDYPDDEEAIVSLLEGKVRLDNRIKSEEGVILLPGKKAVLNKQCGHIRVNQALTANAVEWTKGYLLFDEELLPDIAKKLERSYNVKIRIADPALRTYRFYGNFVCKEQTIQEVLDALVRAAAAEHLDYQMEGRVVTLCTRPIRKNK